MKLEVHNLGFYFEFSDDHPRPFNIGIPPGVGGFLREFT